MSASVAVQQREVARAPTPRDHHLIAGGGSRLTVCGLIPPWHDSFTCTGTWRGESTCTDCGGPMCATCVRLAREGS